MNSRSVSVNMTEGKLVPSIIRYVIPLAFTGILQQLFNAADLAVVGQFVGKEAMAAVGSNASIIGLVVNLFVGISLGANIVIAQAIGKGDEQRIGKAVHTSIMVAVLAGFTMMAFGEVISRPLISILGVPDDVYSMALVYLRVYLLGLPVILLFNFEAAIFRGRGNSRTPLIALTISGVVNVILNVFFVVALGLDVAGVAIATVISNLISSTILFICLLRTHEKIHVSFSKLRIDWKVLAVILRIGVPAGIQSMMFSLSNIIVQSAINSLGSTVMAASSAAFNIEILAFFVMNAFGQACSTFTGQNYGAGNARRCRQILKTCLIMAFVATESALALILIFSHQLLGIFNSDPAVIEVGIIRMEFVAITYLFSLVQEVTSGYLRAFGISEMTAIVSIFGVCGTRILWIFCVFPRSPSFIRIMQIYPISLALTALVDVLLTIAIKPSRKFFAEDSSRSR